MKLLEEVVGSPNNIQKSKKRFGKFFCDLCKSETIKLYHVGQKQLSCGCARYRKGKNNPTYKHV